MKPQSLIVTTAADVVNANDGVPVSTLFSADSMQEQDSFDNTNWNAYAPEIVFSENEAEYSRGINAMGNISELPDYSADQNLIGQYEIAGKDSGSQQVFLDKTGKYTLEGNFGNVTGSVTVFNGGKKVGTGSIKNGQLAFNKGKSILLDSSLPTEVQVTIKKGTDKDYSLLLTAETLFPTYDPAGNTAANALDLGKVSLPGEQLLSDGWVGFGDEFDFYAFSLDTAAKLSLDLTSTDAAKFTIYDSKGKSLQSTSVKANRATISKAKQLDPGNYYLAVQSTNANKGGNASYTVGINSGTEFFVNIFTSPLVVNYEQTAGKTDVNFSWNAPENAGSRKITYFVSIDGGKETKVTKTSFTAKKLSMTDHTARIYAKDNFGNLSDVTEVNFTIADTTAPKVSGLKVSLSGQTAAVDFKASDNIGVTGFLVDLDGQQNYVSNAELKNGLNFSGLDYGQHTVTVMAMDAADNFSQAVTKSFTVKEPKSSSPASSGTKKYIVGNQATSFIPEYSDTYLSCEGSLSANSTALYTFQTGYAPGYVYFSAWKRLSSAVTATVYKRIDEDANGILVEKVADKKLTGGNYKEKCSFFTEPYTQYFVELSSSKAVDYEMSGTLWESKPNNNSFETAEEVELEDFGDEIEGGFKGLLFSGDKVDFYKFTLQDPASIKIYAGVYDTTKVTLFDSARNQVASKTVTWTTSDPYLRTGTMAAGDYYLKLDLSSKLSDYNGRIVLS